MMSIIIYLSSSEWSPWIKTMKIMAYMYLIVKLKTSIILLYCTEHPTHIFFLNTRIALSMSYQMWKQSGQMKRSRHKSIFIYWTYLFITMYETIFWWWQCMIVWYLFSCKWLWNKIANWRGTDILHHPVVMSSKVENEKGLEDDCFCMFTLRYLSLVCPRKKKTQYN